MPARNIQELHEQACERGENTYRDPDTGYLVFTAHALKTRGYCCNSGCRHCPYKDVEKFSAEQARWLTELRPEPGKPSVLLFWSGGKDSFLAYRALARKEDRQIVLLNTFDADSGMIAHQDIHSEVVAEQAGHLGLPVIGVPLHPARDYIEHVLLALDLLDNCEALAFGDLHLEHIREWRVNAFADAQRTRELSLLFPIWKVPYEELMKDLQASNASCHVSAVAKPGLDISIGDAFDEQLLERLPEDADRFGENGEFHTKVMFK